jgi:hypothetical protein
MAQVIGFFHSGTRAMPEEGGVFLPLTADISGFGGR